MSRRRNNKHSNKKKGVVDDYGHHLRPLHITKDTFKGISSMKSHVLSADWIDPNCCHENKGGKGKGPWLKSKPMEEMIKSKAKSYLKKLRKKNMLKFCRDFASASADDQYEWLINCSIGFRPTKEQIKKWNEMEFDVVTLLSLISKRQPGVREQLGLSVGIWTNMVSIHDEILRGELTYILDYGDASDESYESDSENNDNKIKSTKKRKKISGGSDNENNDSDDGDTKKRKKILKKKNEKYWVTGHTERNSFETSSNYKRKKRNNCEHPYLVRKGSNAEFLVALHDPRAKDLPTFVSSSGNKYTYDEDSFHFGFDQILLKKILLRDHGLLKLHKRIIAQTDAVQNEYTNKSITGYSEVRCNGGTEFQVGVTIGNMLGLLGLIKEEHNAYDINRQLIDNDEFKTDYLVGEWNSPYEKRNRLPRSRRQIEELKNQNKYTAPVSEFWIRVNLFTKKAKMSSEEWTVFKDNLSKWGVLDYMLAYVVLFWPGREEEAQQIGLIPENIQINGDLNIIGNNSNNAQNDEQKDDVQMLQDFL